MIDQIILGSVYTMDSDCPYAEAVGFSAGKIAFVGTREEASQLSADSVLDAGTHAVFPGFIDTHVHVIPSGLFAEAVDLSDVKDIPEICRRIKQHAKNVPEEQWIFGIAFQDKNVLEKRFPNRWELDSATDKHPIMIWHNDCHPSSFNSMGLKMVCADPRNQGVETNSAGEMTGFFNDYACGFIQPKLLAALGEEGIMHGVHEVDDYAVSCGVTTVFGKDALLVLQLREKNKEQLKAEFIPMWMGTGYRDYEGLEALAADERLRSKTCVCGFADGTIDAMTATITDPYEGYPTEFGLPFNSDDELYDFAMAVRKKGMQFSCHCIGDRAIEQTLKVYKRVLRDCPCEDHRFRIEHFEMPAKASIKMAAELNVALGMQPLLIEICQHMDNSGYAPFIGKRVNGCSPYRSILDAGILVGGGTDYPVTPMQVLHGAKILMQHPNPAERITLMECLEMNTVNAAKLGFLENRKGMLKVGMDADAVILSDNPFAVSVESLSDIRVEHTFCKGKEVYSAE